MTVKAIELVRCIRDKHYKETKDLQKEEQIVRINNQSIKLQKILKKFHPKGNSKKLHKMNA